MLADDTDLAPAHFRRLVSGFVAYYHSERHHQGLGNRLIEPAAEEEGASGPVPCRERLVGILKYYHR